MSNPLTAYLDSGAKFSEDRLYRYYLWRYWGGGIPQVWLMLNPSTADERANDPTVERCERRARAAGFCGLVVLNLYALRSTKPEELWRVADPVGPLNDNTIIGTVQNMRHAVCAWGAHAKPARVEPLVKRLLAIPDVKLYTLGLTLSGQPRHPLYVPYSAEPTLWTP